LSEPRNDPATRRALQRFLDAAQRTAAAAEEMRKAQAALDRAALRSARLSLNDGDEEGGDDAA
jgi:hypothetical protein